MTTSPITLNKQNSNDFSLLWALNEYTQGEYLSYTLSFLDNIDDIDCLNALSKTCKFFNEILKDKLDQIKPIQEMSGHLLEKRIFESWQDVAKLPELEKPLPDKLRFSQEQIKNIPKSLMRGWYETRPYIIFKTLIRNFDGTFDKYNIEILVCDKTHFFKCSHWQYAYASDRSDSVDYTSIEDNNISRHFENLVKHQPATPLFYDCVCYDSLEGFDTMFDAWHPGRYTEHNTKITADGHSIEELAPDE